MPPENTNSNTTQQPDTRSLWEDAWRRLRKNKLALAGLVYIVIFMLLCLLGPWIAPDHTGQDLTQTYAPPSSEHWLGTDALGRDLLSRILFGGKISLMVGVVATTVSLTIGVIYGIVSGYFGGKTDRIMMRIVEIMYALPFAIFIILLTVILGRELWLIFFAIGAVEWLTMARIVRGQVLALKVQEFVQAARTLGQTTPRIMMKHLLPNLMGTIIVYATLTFPAVMLLESFISFLGLGVQVPDTSLGLLIKDGAEAMGEYPWLLIYPSIIFSLTLFALNFLGDGLRDALDPRAEK